jgi:hypothetical protein
MNPSMNLSPFSPTTTTTTTLDAPRSAATASAKSDPTPPAPPRAQAQDSFERVGTKSAGSVKKIDDPSSVHDRHVQERITGYLDRINNHPNYKSLSVSEKLGMAASQVIGDRERDPTNTELRDVDYYFAARKTLAGENSTAAKVADGAIGTVATGAYIGLKATVGQVSNVMRTDSDKPNSAPGGFMWEQRGTYDGFRDKGATIGPVPNYRRPAE